MQPSKYRVGCVRACEYVCVLMRKVVESPGFTAVHVEMFS